MQVLISATVPALLLGVGLTGALPVLGVGPVRSVIDAGAGPAGPTAASRWEALLTATPDAMWTDLLVGPRYRSSGSSSPRAHGLPRAPPVDAASTAPSEVVLKFKRMAGLNHPAQISRRWIQYHVAQVGEKRAELVGVSSGTPPVALGPMSPEARKGAPNHDIIAANGHCDSDGTPACRGSFSGICGSSSGPRATDRSTPGRIDRRRSVRDAGNCRTRSNAGPA